jgi:hypothetical protein
MMENITHIRGDTLAIGIQIEGYTQDLESAYFSVKKDLDGSEYILQVQLGDGITKAGTDDKGVYYHIRVAPELTEDLEPGRYYYDVEIGLNSDRFTVLRGILTILPDVTRRDANYV